MRYEWSTVVVDGFQLGESDFADRLAEVDQSVRDQFEAAVLDPLANASDGAMLVIIGHSARHDSAATHQEAITIEGEASKDRAHSAHETILGMLGEKLGSAPSAWSDLPHIGTLVIGCGPTYRVDETGTDDGRLRNRRVEVRVGRFVAE